MYNIKLIYSTYSVSITIHTIKQVPQIKYTNFPTPHKIYKIETWANNPQKYINALKYTAHISNYTRVEAES